MALNEFVIFLFYPLWFILPSYIANIVPLLSRKINFLNVPVDFGIRVRGKRLFGANKTYRGLLFGILAGTITGVLQARPPIEGFILATGGLVGDLLGASLKRQRGIKPSVKAPIYDKYLDVIVALLFAKVASFLDITLLQSIYLIIVSASLNKIFNLIWYKLKIKDVPW